MSESLRQQIVRRKAALWTERSSYFAHWQDLSDMFLPRRGKFLGGQKNKPRRNDKILNGSPLRDARVCAAGLMSHTANPSSPWFRTTTPDPDLAEFHTVRAWLSLVEERLRWLFELSRIYSTIHGGFVDLVVFGTAASVVERDDPRSYLRGYNLPVGQYALATDARQQVDTCYREFGMTVAQLVQRFGRKACSQRVREMYDRRQLDTWVDVIHAIEPNTAHESGTIGPRGKAWRSIWLEVAADDQTGVLREAGYDVFPALTPRWEVNGEDVYGSNCPGMEARSDAKALQWLEEKKSLALDLILEPPTVGPPVLMGSGVGLLPGSFTSVDVSAAGQQIHPAVEVPFQTMTEARTESQERARGVSMAFMTDLWLYLQTAADGPKTATEIATRKEEGLIQVGPAILRMMDEYLRPLVDQGFAALVEHGLLPPAPDELQGQELRVEFTSPLAQALKLVGVSAIERGLSFVGQLAQVKPEVLDKLDGDEAVDTYFDALGVPPKLVLADEVVAQNRQMRAAQAQAQQQGEALLQATQGAANLAKPMGDDSVLARLIGSNGGTPSSAGVP